MGFISKERRKAAERKFANSLRRPNMNFSPEVETDYTRLLRARHARRAVESYGMLWAAVVAASAVASAALAFAGVA